MRLIYPHQLFVQHLEAADDTVMVLVENDLFFRQYAFHAQKLVLHRASMRRFAARLESAGFDVRSIETSAYETSGSRLSALLSEIKPKTISVYDVVDDWLARDTLQALADAGYERDDLEVLESPNFVTTRDEVRGWFAEHPARMQHFYSWQRQRLDIMVDGDQPVGGQWSFDEDNRKKLPRGHRVPDVLSPDERVDEVSEAIEWAGREFPDAPGDASAFAWPTSHDEAQAGFEDFLAHRFAEFGPFEDAISKDHAYLFHSLLTPGLNIGLLEPGAIVERALEVGESDDIPLASVEGFVRQIIGWREFMRATYLLWGRQMRTSNRLEHARSLDQRWWTGETGLLPVDHVIKRLLISGYAHHIERLMVLGNAMSLLRIDPDEVYEWFMEMFIDSYDWVMVPNVYAMSQFASGEAITTKPYVSGSNYLKKMSDLPPGEWRDDWDGLYWTFVSDHREVFEANFRSRMMTKMWDGMDEAKQREHLDRAAKWLG
ncbi:cryptochrome/photolyase family protein [Ornithinimicrobium sp. Arc0846-15]|nr:cryptochrome/photolyase family protein [Ornithinimicrobium laminariae]